VSKGKHITTEIISQPNGLLLKKVEETKIEPKKFETFGSQRFNPPECNYLIFMITLI
jgi:hypothetical protein